MVTLGSIVLFFCIRHGKVRYLLVFLKTKNVSNLQDTFFANHFWLHQNGWKFFCTQFFKKPFTSFHDFLKIENYAGKLSRWQGQKTRRSKPLWSRIQTFSFKIYITFSTFFMNQIYADLELYFGMIWYECKLRKDWTIL